MKKGVSVYNLCTINHTDSQTTKQVYNILNKGFVLRGKLPRKATQVYPRGKAYVKIYALGFKSK